MLQLRCFCIRNCLFPKFCSSLAIRSRSEAVGHPFESPEQTSPYYVENGLRNVYPYYSTYTVFCKGRWVNRKLLDVYSTEYGLFPPEVYIKRISDGLLKVNNKIVSTDYVLKNGDFISATDHRHELGVLATDIEILFEDDDFLVVNKPPSIPIHPTGLYRHNTMLFILANEHNYHNLYVIYRLDRLSSGVLVFAKSKEKSRQLHDDMTMGNIKKEYICRVEGNFPDDTVICNKPIKNLYHKIGVNMVHPLGKIAISEFKKISYNGKSSVVLCKLHTGRTHQIRVHLQFLGYPIINDPLYNSPIFGSEKGKNGAINKSIDELLEDLSSVHSEMFLKTSLIKYASEDFLNTTIFKNYAVNDKFLSTVYKKNDSRVTHDKDCYFCYTLPNHNPEQKSLGIFLHAYRYEGKGWEFKTDMPFWAMEDWNVA